MGRIGPKTSWVTKLASSEGLSRSVSRPRRSRASGLVDSGRPAFRPTRARPAAVERERLTGSRRLSRSSPLADARARLHRLRRQLHDERIRIQRVAEIDDLMNIVRTL